MKFSVIIVNYADSWALISACVASLGDSDYEDFEVIVSDNDPTPPRNSSMPDDVRVVSNGRNLGFARAVNRGIATSTGEFVVLINPDSTVGPAFFEGVERFFGGSPGVGVVGPRITDSDGTLQLSARREVSLLSGLFGRTSLLTRLLPRSEFVRSQFPAVMASDSPTVVDWVSGACLVVRRETLEAVGLLDERFFMYFEDADLCRRARESGYGVVYLPFLGVTHEAGGSTKDRPRAILDLHKSAFLYHRKHGRRGPFGLFSAAIAVGLAARAAAKLLKSARL